MVQHNELLGFVGRDRFFGRGIGWIDVDLLASARLSGLPPWTLDRRLADAARALGVVA